MKKGLDSIIYVIACVLSLGSLWVLRIVITKGILFAQEQSKVKNS